MFVPKLKLDVRTKRRREKNDCYHLSINILFIQFYFYIVCTEDRRIVIITNITINFTLNHDHRL